MINPSNAPFFPGVEELLSWTSRRQQALAGNVANMDTPGYRAQYYSFRTGTGHDSSLNHHGEPHCAAKG